MADILALARCPLCEAPLHLKRWSGGLFLGCSRYPHCRGARKPSHEELAEIEKRLREEPTDNNGGEEG
jgi:ssDNA-binding Zn-finger/Zn-ribbon topoisomerase 1